jgi:hypothetical protein
MSLQSLFPSLLAAVLIAAQPAAADPFQIFATGQPGPTGQTRGYVTGAMGFTGVRIFVPSTVVTQSIGGHFASLQGSDLFGAIVALTDPFDLPDSEELTTPDVLGATRVIISATGEPVGSRIVSAPIEMTLTPGWYGLVFGAGLFGATGTGLFVFDNFPHALQHIFANGGVERQGLPFQNGVLGQGRLYAFVEARPVPEPSTILLCTAGAIGLFRLRRRRQQKASSAPARLLM